MKNISDLTSKIGDIADDSFESSEERQVHLSSRHNADMISDNLLSKSIRPLTLIILLILECLIVLLDAFGKDISVELQIQVGTLLVSAFGFYFSSKKSERIAEKNAKANIEIEKLKIKSEIKNKRKRLFGKHEEEEFDKQTD